MSSTGKGIGSAAVKSALQKIQDGQYYDGAQLVTTLMNRCISRGLYDDALKLCRLFGLEMVKVNQFDLAANFGLQMIKIFNDFGLIPTDERIQAILDLFTPTPNQVVEERNRFIERAIKWASDMSQNSDRTFVTRLHRAAAKGYQEFGLYGQAQGHLVFCMDANALALLVKEWREKGYASEHELFVLRLVLILLAKGDIDIAKSFIESSVFGFNFDSPILPPPIQFGYLLIEACRTRNVDFFDTLQTKYMLVIRRNQTTFKRLLQCIDQTIFNRQQGSTNILGMLSGLLGHPHELE